MSNEGQSSNQNRTDIDREKYLEEAVVEARSAFDRQSQEIISERQSIMKWIRIHFLFLALAFAAAEFGTIRSTPNLQIVLGVIIVSQFLGIVILAHARTKLTVYIMGFGNQTPEMIWENSEDYSDSLEQMIAHYNNMVDINRSRIEGANIHKFLSLILLSVGFGTLTFAAITT